MIDLVFWPFASHVHVSKPMGFVFHTINLNYNVSIFVIATSGCTNRSSLPTLDEVIEPTIIRVVE